MKLQGWVKGKKVLILIDSRAIHNFISVDLVADLGLTIEEIPPYKVFLGDGHGKSPVVMDHLECFKE